MKFMITRTSADYDWFGKKYNLEDIKGNLPKYLSDKMYSISATRIGDKHETWTIIMADFTLEELIQLANKTEIIIIGPKYEDTYLDPDTNEPLSKIEIYDYWRE